MSSSSTEISKHFQVRKSNRIAHAKATKKDAVPGGNKADQDEDMKTLKQFDLDWKYGPCMGMSRLERWERAEKFGMNPAPEIRDLILSHKDDEMYTQCLWNDYKIL